MNLLRLFLKNCLLRNNRNECALFLVGVGLTGKSTFTKLLTRLFGPRAGVLELTPLSNRFEFSGLVDNINDVNPRALALARCSDLKQLASNENRVSEKKHEKQVAKNYKGLIILTGNERFRESEGHRSDPSGIGRRVLCFPCRTVPLEINTNLVDHLYQTIVNWALGCDLRSDMLIGQVQTLNMYLDGDQQDSMEDFISSCLFLAGWSREALGATKESFPDTLYGKYLDFCHDSCYRPCTGQEFRGQLCAHLSMLKVPYKPIRTKKGWERVGGSRNMALDLSRGHSQTQRNDPHTQSPDEELPLHEPDQSCDLLRKSTGSASLVAPQPASPPLASSPPVRAPRSDPRDVHARLRQREPKAESRCRAQGNRLGESRCKIGSHPSPRRCRTEPGVRADTRIRETNPF